MEKPTETSMALAPPALDLIPHPRIMENEKTKNSLLALQGRILHYGKENLYDILHFTSAGLLGIFECSGTRIFLEDLAEGLLICRYALSEKYEQVRGTSCFISNIESMVSRAFVTRKVAVSWEKESGKILAPNAFEKKLGILESVAMPIVEGNKSVGVLCLDYAKRPSDFNDAHLLLLEKFLESAAPLIKQASRYHQEINFSRQLDAIRKKNVATIMLRSSVKLIEKLVLASVLVPQANASSPARKGSAASPETIAGSTEVLAAYSTEGMEEGAGDDPDFLASLKMEDLLDEILQLHPSRGVIRKKEGAPLFFKDLLKENLSRKKTKASLSLRSLYMVPRFDPETAQLVCVVNYYTREPYVFSEFEKELLNDHASMLERMIQDVGREHIEIKILGEIESLRREKISDLPHFLKRVLSMASELIGADTGTISLQKTLQGTKWLVVEDEQGGLIGAKAREWQKAHIPPLRVGGEEIPRAERSLTGLAAHAKKPVLCNNVRKETTESGFYLEVSSLVNSELAVPILSGEEVLGVISLDSFEESYFTMEHQRILSIISQLIAERIGMQVKIETLQEEIRLLQKELDYRDPKVSSYSLGNVIGKSSKVREIVDRIHIVSEYLAGRLQQWREQGAGELVTGIPTILITGKTGSGKEFFFNNIYSALQEVIDKESGKKQELPLRKTNIAAYSGELTYSELFGHKKGAFTGADSDRKGILEEADGGVVFLDEIGDADQKTQVQLLRFLDSGVFMRLGENKSRHSHVVLVAATNKNLQEEIRKGRFREDLYHRLHELTLQVPSLNERHEDIPDLATHFLGKLYMSCKKKGESTTPPLLTEEAKKFLSLCHFKGSVRELRSVLLRALLFRKGNRITVRDIRRAFSEEEMKLAEADCPSRVREILDRIQAGETDFWQAVYQPYSEKTLTRQAVKEIIERGRLEFGGGIPNLAVKLGVCASTHGVDKEESLKYQRFKNFIYKTIRIAAS